MPNICKPSTHEHLRPPNKTAFHSIRTIVQGLVEPLFLDRIGIEGEEHIQSQTGAYALAARHRSNLDVPAIGSALWRADHQAAQWMAKIELEKIPVLGRLLEECGAYYLAGERGNRHFSEENIEYLNDAIAKKAVLPIFPGGTRLKGPGINKDDVKRSVILPLAFEFGLPIVPVGHEGTEKGDRGFTEVVFGEAIQREKVDFNPDPDWGPGRRLAKLSKAVGETAIDDLTEELREGMIAAQDRAHERRQVRKEHYYDRLWAGI